MEDDTKMESCSLEKMEMNSYVKSLERDGSALLNHLTSRLVMWREAVNEAEKDLVKLKSKETLLKTESQTIFQQCCIQIIFFGFIVSSVAFLVNSRFITRKCRAFDVTVFLAGVFFFGIIGAVFLTFYNFRRLRDEVHESAANRIDLRMEANQLLCRSSFLESFLEAIEFGSDLLEGDAARLNKLREIQNSFKFVKIQDKIFRGLTCLLAIGATLYALAFPYMTYTLLCHR